MQIHKWVNYILNNCHECGLELQIYIALKRDNISGQKCMKVVENCIYYALFLVYNRR